MELADHLFAPTMGNRCGRTGCARTRDAHPVVLPTPKLGEVPCTVDHATLRTKQFKGPDGWEWTRCMACGTMLEPPYAARA